MQASEHTTSLKGLAEAMSNGCNGVNSILIERFSEGNDLQLSQGTFELGDFEKTKLAWVLSTTKIEEHYLFFTFVQLYKLNIDNIQKCGKLFFDVKVYGNEAYIFAKILPIK